MTVPGSRPQRALRLAHRGDHRAAVENSLEAMRAAVGAPGIDGLEFDVRASGDGVPILLHDETLERTHGVAVRPRGLAASELVGLGVAALADVLAAVPDTLFLDVELKADVGALVAPLLVERLERGGRLVASSFEPPVLLALARVEPRIVRWLNSETLDAAVVAVALDLGCAAVSVRRTAIDERTAALAADAGLELAAWTATTPEEVARLERLGCVAICVEEAAFGV